MTWPTTDAFKTALQKSHTPTMKVEILRNGVVVASTDVLSMVEDLNVLKGSVSDDRKAQVGRRTADWEVVDRTGRLAPLSSALPIHPLQDRDVRLWRGINSELVPLATVQLTNLKGVETENGLTYSLSGVDRSAHLASSDWRSEFEIADGTTPYAATVAILAQVDPSHTYTVVSAATTKVLDEMVFLPGEDPNPWDAIVKIWESTAMEVYFDQMGNLKAQPYINAATAPVAWQYLRNEANLRLEPLNVDVDRETLRNGVIVRGTAPWLLYGVSAEAWDTNPASPTYYDPANPLASAVGPRPEYIDDSLVGDETEAQALADARLPELLGVIEQVTFSAIPNPALEAGDVVEISADVFSTTPRFVLDQLTTPLTWDGTQSAVTRRRTT